MTAWRIRVNGTVQGVGFRPMVWRLARDCGIRGRVWNDAAGVVIDAWIREDGLDAFLQKLRRETPPLARIEDISCTQLASTGTAPDTFEIVESGQGQVQTNVAADAATCPDCLADILDPANRRYRYPFTNCTHCGPRLSIIRAIPYDRANTSMADFEMCPQCRAEYEDPSDRRFHAQPNACPDCGPRLWLEDRQGNELPPDSGRDAIATAARLIREGWIIAIKGIGGIHLACDATCDTAVSRLRKRKHRYAKALALMASDIAMIERYASMDAAEAELLRDMAAPIVVLRASGQQLAADVAPGQNSLGFMLPYTPLHHLLMQELDAPIVLTSGNRSEEPQAISNADARLRLKDIADAFLLHDRNIVNRLDDSVIRMADGQSRMLRRARGYAPEPIKLPRGFDIAEPILALGGELKNTFCLATSSGRAVLSQHIGNLEEPNTFADFRRMLALYQRLFGCSPRVIVIDRHPDYLSSQLGKRLAEENGLELVGVQHHHAHIASCMVEHGRELTSARVLGIVLDGLGYGENDELWGGEFLLADYFGSKRIARFQPVPLLGGNKATYEPWRNTLAHLLSLPDVQQLFERHADLPIIEYLNTRPLTVLQTMFDKRLNSPPASSAGRLFDAVAAALGICREAVHFEGQAAMELEAVAAPQMPCQERHAYPWSLEDNTLVWAPMWHALLVDLQKDISRAVIAARFHHCLANALAHTAAGLCREQRIHTVVLSGGVFQNRLLLERTSLLLREKQLEVLSPHQYPANDGGLSLGQAAIALAARHAGSRAALE
ncbi:carbamoyltransferase HypF [Thiolapillus sp.]